MITWRFLIGITALALASCAGSIPPADHLVLAGSEYGAVGSSLAPDFAVEAQLLDQLIGTEIAALFEHVRCK